MKRILLSAAILLASAFTLSAQTPSEIVSRMSEELDKGKTEGQAFDLNMQIPILGKNGARTWLLGEKYKMMILGRDDATVTWRTADTEWEYDPTENTVTIKHYQKTESDSGKKDDVKSFQGLDREYDLKITREDDKAWYMTGKKAKTNTNKDDPATIKLIVSKETFLPISYSCKEKGIGISMENFQVGVSEEEVTFNPDLFPGAKIIDQR